MLRCPRTPVGQHDRSRGRPPGLSPERGEVAMRASFPMARICLHCVLARALRAEAGILAARGLEVKLGPSEAVFLPGSGVKTYRRLRSLLREAAAQASGERLKLSVLDLPGKSHVEVTATF